MGGPKVLLGMSGGVDSSVAAAILVEQGFDVRGVTLKVWEEEDESSTSKRWQERGCCKVGLAKHVAKLLDIPHQVVDTRETFRSGVVDDFIEGYLEGTTPNPCVRCNERVKFGELYRLARNQGVEYVATGHYARIQKSSQGDLSLHCAEDATKDQSYFLYRLSPSWLPHIVFPLGEVKKSQVWNKAESMGLPTEELKESQEICFVTQDDYREFIKVNAPQARRPGVFVDSSGLSLGRHEGIAFYTPGQRKGLGLATGKRLYVNQVIPETNTIVVGSQEELATWECCVSELNLFEAKEPLDGAQVEVKIRYASPPVPATLTMTDESTVLVKFVSPQWAVSPGQSAVFYKKNRVLGGGIIKRMNRSHLPSLPLLPGT